MSNTAKVSEINFTDEARELAELFLDTTELRVLIPDYKWDKGRKGYFYVSDGMNYIIVGKERNIFSPWYATFPIKPSRDYGSGIILPTDSNTEIETPEEVVKVAQRYMGATIEPGPIHCEGFYGNKVFANNLGRAPKLIEVIKD